MKMCIFIKDLCFETIIGILPNERVKAQKVTIHAKIKYHYKDSMSYIDYADVANCIMECVQTKHYDLLENALQDIAKHCFQEFKNIDTMKLYIEKPDILTHCKVGMQAKFSKNKLQTK